MEGQVDDIWLSDDIKNRNNTINCGQAPPPAEKVLTQLLPQPDYTDVPQILKSRPVIISLNTTTCGLLHEGEPARENNL